MSETEATGWLRAVVYSCHDYEAMAAFYRRILDLEEYEVVPGWVGLRSADRPEGAYVCFEPATDERPAGIQGSSRIDIEVDDLDVAQAELEAAGATLISVVHANPAEEHRVMADPEGNELNIVLPIP